MNVRTRSAAKIRMYPSQSSFHKFLVSERQNHPDRSMFPTNMIWSPEAPVRMRFFNIYFEVMNVALFTKDRLLKMFPDAQKKKDAGHMVVLE